MLTHITRQSNIFHDRQLDTPCKCIRGRFLMKARSFIGCCSCSESGTNTVPTCADWASRQATKPLHAGQTKMTQHDATWRNMTQHDATWHNMTPCFNCLCPSCFNCFCPPREPLSFEQCHHDDPRWSTRCYHDICTPAEGLRPQWASTRLPELDLSTQTDISSNHTSLCNCKRCRPLWIPGIKTLT